MNKANVGFRLSLLAVQPLLSYIWLVVSNVSFDTWIRCVVLLSNETFDTMCNPYWCVSVKRDV